MICFSSAAMPHTRYGHTDANPSIYHTTLTKIPQSATCGRTLQVTGSQPVLCKDNTFSEKTKHYDNKITSIPIINPGAQVPDNRSIGARYNRGISKLCTISLPTHHKERQFLLPATATMRWRAALAFFRLNTKKLTIIKRYIKYFTIFATVNPVVCQNTLYTYIRYRTATNTAGHL